MSWRGWRWCGEQTWRGWRWCGEQTWRGWRWCGEQAQADSTGEQAVPGPAASDAGWAARWRLEPECHLRAVGSGRTKQIRPQLKSFVCFVESQASFGHLEAFP